MGFGASYIREFTVTYPVHTESLPVVVQEVLDPVSPMIKVSKTRILRTQIFFSLPVRAMYGVYVWGHGLIFYIMYLPWYIVL